MDKILSRFVLPRKEKYLCKEECVATNARTRAARRDRHRRYSSSFLSFIDRMVTLPFLQQLAPSKSALNGRFSVVYFFYLSFLLLVPGTIPTVLHQQNPPKCLVGLARLDMLSKDIA